MTSQIQIYPNDLTEIDMSHLIDELRMQVRTIPQPVSDDVSAGISEWMKNCYRLRELILLGNPEKFLRWDVLLHTMVVTSPPYMSVELNSLLTLPEWATRWQTAVAEPQMGWPLPFPAYPASSGNLLHQAYHLSQFEKSTKLRIDQMEYIFEFGGGYGSMAHLCHALGFRGKYVIFDFPIFSALQTFYLKALGYSMLESAEAFQREYEGIFCMSDIDQLEEVLPLGEDIDPGLFIATWSLSETPFELRQKFLSQMDLFHAYLFAYQDSFEKRDNFQYFEKWRQRLVGFESKSWPIKHLPANYYMMGKRGINI
ncbi:MAG: hypothetical protein DWQ05_00005 [Calditrichaeota bacterium]|nr:MAG: hypothetical protein DWQ05_00005 [Calditrichota bacterium]